jgi:hypothetical protein
VNRERLTGTALLAGVCWLAAACGKQPDQKPLSTRARESALAKSGLPGATGIGSALRVSDSADARRRREDSVANAVP